ncbi:hypothetical protein P3534_22810, partial [Vibrio parahaemolyticus]|nr:hypothetical protein [Vibrio parahaemolyticus]
CPKHLDSKQSAEILLKCLLDMVYHERTYTGSQTGEYSEKTRLAGRVFSHLENRLSPQFIDRNKKKLIITLIKTT